MQVFSNSPTILAAVKFFESKYDISNTETDILFESMPKGHYGDCNIISDTEFVIDINKKMCMAKKLITIFHELTHVYQVHSGKWDVDARVFNSKEVSEDTPYCQEPWEIEAYEQERKLYKEFKRTRI